MKPSHFHALRFIRQGRRLHHIHQCVFRILIGCLGIIAVSVSAQVDLSVANIEITQAIQTPANTVQLVALRSTAVRVRVGVSGTGSPVSGVTGRLHVFVNGSEITPLSGLAPVNGSITAPLSGGWNRENEDDTLNFELLAPTAIIPSTDVDFHVDITPVVSELNVSNNGGDVNNLTFVEKRTPCLFYTSINYPPSGLGLPNATLIAPGVGDMFVRGIFPVNDGDPDLYRAAPFASLSFSGSGSTTPNMLGGDGTAMLNLLESCRLMIVNSGPCFPADRVFLYGWFAGPVTGNGLSSSPGHVACGNTELTRFQRTYAHELDHNFGFGHNSSTLAPEVGWDVGRRLYNNPIGNNVTLATSRAKPMNFFDIMVAGQFTDRAWIDIPDNYGTLLTHGWLQPDTDEPLVSTNVFWLRGILNSNGTQVIQLDPVFRYGWQVQSASGGPRITNQFSLRVTDSSSNVSTIPFSAENAVDDTNANFFGFFSVMIPATAPNINLVQITRAGSTNELMRISRSASPPQVQILSPSPGAQLGGQSSLLVTVSDQDTPITNLQYQVAYSPNDGQTWVPLRVNLRGGTTNIFLNTTELQKTKGRGRIRFLASDGLNTTYTDVGNLALTAAIYENPAEPTLLLTRSSNTVVLSWFKNSTTSILQSSTNLVSWSDMTNPPAVDLNNLRTVTITNSGPAVFFRLR